MNDPMVRLNPARPYQGKSQHQAVRAAVTRLVEAGVVAEYDRVRHRTDLPMAAVRSQHQAVHGVWTGSVELWFSGSRYATDPWRPGFDDAVAGACAALRAAGWTVTANGDRSFFVHGPGADVWAKSQRAADAAEHARARAADADAAKDVARVDAALAAAGVHVSASVWSRGAVTVTLNAAQFDAVIAAAKDGRL